MHPLYTQQQFDKAKSRDSLPLKCVHCGNTFYKQKKYIKEALSEDRAETANLCSSICRNRHIWNGHTRQLDCQQCGQPFTRKVSQIKKTNNQFCCKSCAARWNNAHKKHGTRRSKLEVWLEEHLKKLYPDTHFDFNQTNAIDAELDIYIPSLRLAFELNGIFHYEPIYGKDKLGQIQENDISKSKACHDAKVDLCIIDASGLSYFKTKNAQKYLDIVVGIINERLLLII